MPESPENDDDEPSNDDALLLWLKSSIVVLVTRRRGKVPDMLQLAILLHCQRAGELETATTISVKLGVKGLEAYRAVDRLVAAALVQRLPHPTDKRSVMIKVTPSGHALCRRLAYPRK